MSEKRPFHPSKRVYGGFALVAGALLVACGGKGDNKHLGVTVEPVLAVTVESILPTATATLEPTAVPTLVPTATPRAIPTETPAPISYQQRISEYGQKVLLPQFAFGAVDLPAVSSADNQLKQYKGDVIAGGKKLTLHYVERVDGKPIVLYIMADEPMANEDFTSDKMVTFFAKTFKTAGLGAGSFKASNYKGTPVIEAAAANADGSVSFWSSYKGVVVSCVKYTDAPSKDTCFS